MFLWEINKLREQVIYHINKEDTSLNELHEALGILISTISHIKKAINTHAIIHKLPQEILIRIFSFLQDKPMFIDSIDDKVFNLHHFKVTSVLLPMTMVCHHWRDMLINAPLLWTAVSYPYPRRSISVTPFKYFSRLPCSRGLGPGLSVYTKENPGDPSMSGTESFLRQYSHRIRELFVDLSRPLIGSLIPPSLSFVPDKLECLIIKNVTYPYTSSHITLFQGRGLRLHSLSLTNLNSLPTNLMSTTLTRLIIVATLFIIEVSVPNMLRFLKGTPALQEAYLKGFVEGVDDMKVSPVPLRHMRKISVASQSNGGVALLLAHLILPTNCLMRAQVDLSVPSEIQSLATLFERNNSWHQTKLHCLWGKQYITGEPSDISLQVIGPSRGGIRVDLSNKHDHSLEEVDAALRCLLSCSSFAIAEEVWLSGHNARRFLELPLANVKTLHLLSIDTFAPPSVLIEPTFAPFFVDPEALQQHSSIEHRYRLTTGDALEHLHVCLPDMTALDSLVDLLKTRAEVGQPLKTLHVSVPASEASSMITEVRYAVQPFMEHSEVGQNLYDVYSWWRILPKECTSQEETHELWPVWAEGATDIECIDGSLARLSGRSHAAFGTEQSAEEVEESESEYIPWSLYCIE